MGGNTQGGGSTHLRSRMALHYSSNVRVVEGFPKGVVSIGAGVPPAHIYGLGPSRETIYPQAPAYGEPHGTEESRRSSSQLLGARQVTSEAGHWRAKGNRFLSGRLNLSEGYGTRAQSR